VGTFITRFHDIPATMLSLGQKLIAVGMLAFLELVAFLFFPIAGVIGLFFAIPMAILICKR
jgi:hypothetical protein